MSGGVGVQFEANFEDIKFSINENLEIDKIDGGNIDGLTILGYNEGTLNVENYYEEVSYGMFFDKNIEISFDKDSFEEWTNIAKEYLIESEFHDYITSYVQKKYNLVEYTSVFYNFKDEPVITPGYYNEEKLDMANEFIEQFRNRHFGYLEQEGMDEYKKYLVGTKSKNPDEINNKTIKELSIVLAEEYKQMVLNAKLDKKAEKEIDKKIDETLKYLENKVKFRGFDGIIGTEDWKIENMFWAGYVRGKLEEGVELFHIENGDLDISWNSEFILEFDENDKIVKEILEGKEAFNYSVKADDIYDLLEKKDEERELEGCDDIQDLFDVKISFTIKQPFVDFYYNVFENDNENDG